MADEAGRVSLRNSKTHEILIFYYLRCNAAAAEAKDIYFVY
jgi:hypothetical protein